MNPQQVIYLPSRSAVLDGSKSKDDEIIVGYHWTRAGSSPAAGVSNMCFCCRHLKTVPYDNANVECTFRLKNYFV